MEPVSAYVSVSVSYIYSLFLNPVSDPLPISILSPVFLTAPAQVPDPVLDPDPVIDQGEPPVPDLVSVMVPVTDPVSSSIYRPCLCYLV